MVVEGGLVEGAGLPVDGDEERLVAHRFDRLGVVAGDVGGDLPDPVGVLQHVAQRHRPLQDPVDLFDVGDTFGLGQFQEFLLKNLLLDPQLVGSEGVVKRHGRAVVDRLADRVLVEVPLRVPPAEHPEGASAVGGLVDRRAGEPDVGGVGQRPHEEVPQVAGGGAVGLVDEDEHVVPGDEVRRHVVELVDRRDDQSPMVGLEELSQMPLRLGDLDMAEPDGLEVREELGLQLVAVHQHEHRRVLEQRRLDQLLRRGDHRERLPRPLGVPDQPPPLLAIGGPLHHLVDSPHLMGPQHDLTQLVVATGEQDEVGEDPQHPLGMHEGPDEVLIAAGGLVPPVQQHLRRQRPGGPVEEVDELGKGVHLKDRQQLRGLAVIADDLVERLGDTLLLRRRLGLHHDHRHPVDEEHDIGTNRLRPVGVGKLGRDMERVPTRVLHVEKPDVTFPILVGHEHRLQPPQVLPGIEVPLDRRPHLDEPLGDVLRPAVVQRVRVQLL